VTTIALVATLMAAGLGFPGTAEAKDKIHALFIPLAEICTI